MPNNPPECLEIEYLQIHLYETIYAVLAPERKLKLKSTYRVEYILAFLAIWIKNISAVHIQMVYTILILYKALKDDLNSTLYDWFTFNHLTGSHLEL